MVTGRSKENLESLADVADDPVLFGELFLGATFTPDQKKVMRAVQEPDTPGMPAGRPISPRPWSFGSFTPGDRRK